MSKLYEKNLNSKLTTYQAGIARCLLKTCEESLRWPMVLHRFVYSRQPTECGIPHWGFAIMVSRIKGYSYGQGYGRHSQQEVYEIGKADLKAIDTIIGENKFIFGDEACETDAAVFGIIAQIIFHDRGPLNKFATGII